MAGVICFPKRRYDSYVHVAAERNYYIDSRQISLNGKDRQVLVVVCAPGAKSALYEFLVSMVRIIARSNLSP